jgi:hypothetical protein
MPLNKFSSTENSGYESRLRVGIPPGELRLEIVSESNDVTKAAIY